jgi:hypothetical protein
MAIPLGDDAPDFRAGFAAKKPYLPVTPQPSK